MANFYYQTKKKIIVVDATKNSGTPFVSLFVQT